MAHRDLAPRGDALLTSARMLLAVLIGLLLFAAGFILLSIGAILTVERAKVMAKIAELGAPAYSPAVVIVAFLLIIALILITVRFLLELRRMVDSVRDGDPFRPDNADRLARMGWLAVVGQAIWIVVVAVAYWAMPYVEKGGELPDTNLASGLLMILVLFILARVFRVGAAMREDLEGTV